MKGVSCLRERAWLAVVMSRHADATVAPDPIEYLDKAATSAPGRDYKQRLLEVGHAGRQRRYRCRLRPGTDLTRLADAVAGECRVIGVDHDPAMLAETGRELAAAVPSSCA